MFQKLSVYCFHSNAKAVEFFNHTGIRDTARVLKISPTTVINALSGCEFCNFS